MVENKDETGQDTERKERENKEFRGGNNKHELKENTIKATREQHSVKRAKRERICRKKE